ncbi:MAG: hypothetical protein ACOCP8_01160 [archaeon]
MKKYLYLILIILLITNVNALIAGRENTIINVDNCEHLFVNVTGSLDVHEDEYKLKKCSIISNNNYWYCECEDNYDLKIDLDYRAMNNYTFYIESFHRGEPTTITKTRSRGTKVIYINETKDVEENQTKEKEIEKPEENQTTKYINNTETIIEEVEVEKIKEIDTNKKWSQYLIFGIILGMILGIISLYVYIEKQIRSVKK